MKERTLVEVQKKRSDYKTALAYYRNLIGYSQQDLASKSGVTLRMIQKYESTENDIHKAQVDTVHKLAKALGTSIDYLLEYETEN